MTLYEFNTLSIKKKLIVIQGLGKELISMDEGHNTLKLYAINKFFVEVILFTNSGRVFQIKSFKARIKLNYYTAGLKL